MGYCRTETETLEAILKMPLEKRSFGWIVRDNSRIALRTLNFNHDPQPLIVKNFQVARMAIEAGDITFDEPITNPDPDLSFEVPEEKFVIGDSVTFRSHEDGVVFHLHGSSVAYREGSALDTYEQFRESAICEFTKANLPLKIGLVASDKLINIQPVVAAPEL